MKKLVLFIAAVAFGTLGTQAAKLENSLVATTFGYGNSFIFVENGVTFSVYPDGEFDFAALGAAHDIDGLVQAHALHRHIAQLENDIAALQSGFRRRGAIDG